MGKTSQAREMARSILEMLASGRGSDVTDDMMSVADDEYLFNNYDLPMDTESRLGRARDMGFDTDAPMYSSTLDDMSAFSPTGKFMGYTGTSGISMTDSAEAASRYLDRYGDIRWDGAPFSKNVMPLFADFGNVIERSEPYRSNIPMGHPLPDDYVPQHVRQGYDTAIFDDSISRRGSVKHSLARNAITSREHVMSDPSNIRSQFARFDPRLSHLRNLSAGVGGMGLLGIASMGSQDDPQSR